MKDTLNAYLRELEGFETLKKTKKPRFIEGVFYYKNNPIRKEWYNKKALEIVFPDVLITKRARNAVNEFYEKARTNPKTKDIEIWIKILK